MRAARRARGLAALACTATLVVAGCSSTDTTGGDPTPSKSAPTSAPTSATEPSDDAGPAPVTVDPTSKALDVALSTPHEDSVYPDIGDPSVDALHYGLDLTWDSSTDTLTGHETLTFRPTGTAKEFQLDFGEPLEISALTLDGDAVEYERQGKDLVVSAAVRKDQRYQLVIDYAGTPEPIAAPTTRSDLATTGFTIDAEHETWTMQEPYGAFTWYAVNDQPADKALYDFDLHAPTGWTGIANGKLDYRTDPDSKAETESRTVFHLAEPAASYLTTLAFGEYDLTQQKSATGTPIDLWIPRDAPRLVDGPSTTPAALKFLEKYLGPYPFDTAGILVVDSESGMETQTLITLGNTPYSTSPEVVVHELAHQWYGDKVTPDDWRDVWMNEGMAMYLQLMFEAKERGQSIDAHLADYRYDESAYRSEAGPPADYDPTQFGSSNIYFGPAFMWNEIRKRVGDRLFFKLVRGWPDSQDNKSTNRDALFAYWNKAAGTDLTDLFESWLLSPTSPKIS